MADRKKARRFNVAGEEVRHYSDGDSIAVHTVALDFPASPDVVMAVLSQPEDDNGRSEFRWLMLPNGDWFLGVWPHGDTYVATELDREFE